MADTKQLEKKMCKEKIASFYTDCAIYLYNKITFISLKIANQIV